MRITVWYLLIDSEGKPFDENDAYRVYLDADSNPNVADLCDAVKSQNSVSLSHVDQRKLKVYNDIKEGRLEVDCPINGLGSSKNDALLVMVPSGKL
jgi:hypothetical protein